MTNSQLFFFYIFILFLSFSFSTSCTNEPPQPQKQTKEFTQFESISPTLSNINFNNELDVKAIKSPINYINVYNGGGVSVADFNNDGLPDIYFTGNISDNKLFLNNGNFQFEDITQKAGVACAESWSNGSTVADVNNDGFLDIYVCRAYYEEADLRKNQLFINNGNATFTEKSEEYGLADSGYSVTATFLDYDKDGDLDLFVGNHPTDRFKPYGYHQEQWRKPTLEFSDRLYRNNGNQTFTDVTTESGILNYGWTLGVVTADLNEDGWPDLYVSVDHSEPDRYYLNNQEGTFSEVSEARLKHISYSSMGIDAGDINNDGILDLAVVEMLSTNNYDEKTKMGSMDPDKFETFVKTGYHYQYMRNMLHLNMGGGYFSEIGQLANVHRTNWSWAALMADFDNDGWKDFFVSNGYFREYLDKDHFNKFKDDLQVALDNKQPRNGIINQLGHNAPENKVPNNLFKNNGNLTFSEVGKDFGLDKKGFSSGAAYADLDNDGDLDLIVNNINDFASIYKNNEIEDGKNNYLKIKLETPKNIATIGTKVTLKSGNKIQFQQHTFTRGFQSSVDGILHFGLGDLSKIEQVIIEWMDGNFQILENVNANQFLTIKYDKNKINPSLENSNKPKSLFAKIENSDIDFQHQETYFDDYKKQILLPHQLSQLGPFITKGDVNKDGLEDFFIGGGNGQAGQIYLQQKGGTFKALIQSTFLIDRKSEDMGATFFDANNDGNLDLYIVSGGNEFAENSEQLKDRLYLNNGKGIFKKNPQHDFPKSSGSCVKSFDFDGDGDLDLFVGGRQVPGKYPFPASSFILQNDKGKFIDITQKVAPNITNLGMVTDAIWADLNGDKSTDLLVVGEWMNPTVFYNKNGKFEKNELKNNRGWWNKIAKGDFDNDGDEDFLLGNLGLNYKYKATPEKPFHIYAKDFDKNGTFDIALGYFLENETLYPVRGKQCSSEQIPSIGEKFPTYHDFGKASLSDVYGEGLKDALHYEATNFASSILINNGNGNLEIKTFPNEAQFAPINGIIVNDFNNDGNLDALVAGNLYTSEVETGRADAGRGLYLFGNGNGTFQPLMKPQTGLNLEGDVKDLQLIKGQNQDYILVGNNNDLLEVWEYSN